MNTRARIKAIPALLAAGALASLPQFVGAQGGDAASSKFETAWDGLELPEIHLEVLEDTISGMPEELEAGRYRITVKGQPGPDEMLVGPMFGSLPEGLTPEILATQAAESPDGIPAAFYDITIPGSPLIYAPSGATEAVGIVDFHAGNWFMAGYLLSRPAMTFTVTGDLPTDLPEPETNATISVGEMVIELTDGALMVGRNLTKLENRGAQPHFVEFMKVPDGTTNDDITALMESMMTGTPATDGLSFDQLAPAAFISDVSAGQTQWVTVDFAEEGAYVGLCFVADPETGAPHAMMGMHQVFEVIA